VRLLCTQATAQCASHIGEKQSQVIELFRQQANERSDFFFVEQKGCPCAGTVIVELGESARLLQPAIELHQEQIIQGYCDNHKCII
jgi:hypothetical protein